MPRERLPSNIRPVAYRLELEVLPEKDSFSGEVEIDLQFEESLQAIYLHGLKLQIHSVALHLQDGREFSLTWQASEIIEAAAELKLPEAVGPGWAQLRIRYSGDFNHQLEGLYKVEVAGLSYAFTQFEAVSARLAFPCFDEPAFKTSFQLTLLVHQEHVAIGNTRQESEEAFPNGLKKVRFAPTEKLATYLLAWVVGPFDVVEVADLPATGTRTRSLPLRGLATRGHGSELHYALRETPAHVEALEDYFGSEYPFDKLDIIAVPDFAAGAMENPGAITFREQLLLMDESAPEDQKRQFAEVMAHELAHMWFGNLVTMSWWEDLWLNESFAEWMGNRIVRTLYPQYCADLALLDYVHGAMRLDSLQSARQIRQPIESIDDIENAFDGITYEKGMGLLSMIERWLGEDTFRSGIRRYMARHRHGNAVAADLLAALSEESGLQVTAAFESFLLQPGVPLVATEVHQENGETVLRIQQSRYLPVGSTASRQQEWVLPVCIRYAEGNKIYEAATMLAAPQGRMLLETNGTPAWLLPNADGAGYYRWSVRPEDLDRLCREGWGQLNRVERLCVAEGLIAAFDSATLSASEILERLPLLAADSIRSVALLPIDLLRFVQDPLLEPSELPAIRAFALQLYGRHMAGMAWSPAEGSFPEDGEARLLLQRITQFLVLNCEDPELVARAAQHGMRFLELAHDGNFHGEIVVPELTDAALAAAVRVGGPAVFEQALQHFFHTDNAYLRTRLLRAIASTKDPALTLRVSALALDDRLRVNEVLIPLEQQKDQHETRLESWHWFCRNFEALAERIGPMRAGMTPALGAQFHTPEMAAEVEAFFEPRIEQTIGGPRNLATTLERIRLRVARISVHQASAREFFSRFRP